MKLDMNINTSDVTSNNTSKIEKNDNKVNKKKSSNVSNKSCNQSVSDEESEEGERKLIDDEAEEIEMAIYDENSNNELDPSSIGIKKEPVTPQISTTNISINFVDPANSIENEDNKNKSLTNKTHIDDPLDDSNTSTSDSSDNIHIQNYDSVLNELNNSAKNKKKKSADISLNLHKKTKQKTMPIIDELNLTQVKTKKQKQIQNKDEVDAKRSNKSINENLFSKNKPNNEDNDNESSDSIDFHLFFSEDSNVSENLQNKKKNNKVESSIALKQSPGKTNILEISGSKCINASSKKKKQLKKTLGKTVSEDEKGGTDEDVEIRFIMDTTTHNSTEIEKSFNVNTKEKKIKQFVKHYDDSSDSDAPAEVCNKSLKETARKEIEPNEESKSIALSMHSKSITKTPKSEKKKKREKRISESLAMHEGGINSNSDAPAELSIKTFEETERQETNAIEDSNKTILSMQNKSITKTPKSEKKNKRKSESLTQDNRDDKYDSAPAEVSNKSFEDTLREKNDVYEEISNKVSSMHNNSTTKTPKSEKKKKKTSESLETDKSMNHSIMKTPKSEKKKKKKLSESQSAEQINKRMTMKKEIKKRKQREDDEEDKSAKVQRITSPEKAIVPRLPTSILNKLEDKPKKKNLSVTKSKVISTSNFMVEEAKTVKNKPSNYLEESVYLNEDELLESMKQKRIKNPKVLPFLPSVSTSISECTTDFKVNVIPKEFKFIAKSSNVSNFKNDFLENKKIKRLGTYELYKKNRNVKLSKF